MLELTSAAALYLDDNNPSSTWPTTFPVRSAEDIHVILTPRGTGTVTVTDGAAVFSAAQSAIVIGSRVRIAGVVYEVAGRTSNTAFTFKTRPTISASNFHLLDAGVELTPGQFTVDGITSLGATVHAVTPVAATTLVTIYRRTPLKQLTQIATAGPLSATAIEGALDRLTMQVQELTSRVDGTGVGLPGSASGNLLEDTTAFADATARGQTKPRRVNQLGVQLSPAPFTLWRAAGAEASSWEQFKPAWPAVRAFNSISEMMLAAPDYVGQIGWPGSGPFQFRGTATTPGSWIGWYTRALAGWNCMVWRGDEILESGVRRWAGHLGQWLYCDYASVSVDSPGSGALQLRIFVVTHLGRIEVGDAVITVPAGYSTMDVGYESAVHINPALTAIGGLNPLTRVEVEIVSTGAAVTMDTGEGSNVSTPPGSQLPLLTTGTEIRTVDGIRHVLAVNRFSNLILSHQATADLTTSPATAGRASFARGVFFTAVPAGTRVLTVDATTKTLIREGDTVTGSTVEPGTTVSYVNPATNEITLSRGVLASTEYVGILNSARPPVFHYTELDELTGTTFDLPDTTRLRPGDSVLGTNIPSNAIITSKTADDITVSGTVTVPITELTVTYPRRTATVAAGSSNVLLNTGTVPVGSLVSGPGILENTFVQSVSGANAVLTKAATVPLDGETLEFSRDEIQLPGTVSEGETTVVLEYAASTTAIEAGFSIEAAQLPPGTAVVSIAGATLTLSKPAAASGAAVLRLHRSSPWKGLSISLFGTTASV